MCFANASFGGGALLVSCPRLGDTSNKLARTTMAPAWEQLLISLTCFLPGEHNGHPSASAVSTLNLAMNAAAVQRILLLLRIEFSFKNKNLWG
jgi:hypothetical protein